MSDTFTLDILRALAALAFTLGLLVVAAWAMRRYGLGFQLPKTNRPRNLKLLEKLTLNATTTLYLVEHQNHQHLIAATSQQTTLLSTQPKKKKK